MKIPFLKQNLIVLCSILLCSSSIFAQSLFLSGNDAFFVSSGETLSAVGGFKFVGSGTGKMSFPRETAPSTSGSNSKRILSNNANAMFEMRNIGLNQQAIFTIDVTAASNTNIADLTVTNKNSNSIYQLKVNAFDRAIYNDIQNEWTLTRVGSQSTDIHDLIFTWGTNLEPTQISNKRLYVYDNALNQWCQLGVNNTTINDFSKTLTFTGYVGALDGAKFMIAESRSTGDLTIVTSGGDAIGTTWTFKNGVIAALSSSPALINASTIHNYLTSGDLNIEAGNININSAISSSSSNNLVLIASGVITHNATISCSGHLTEWARKVQISQNISVSNSKNIEFKTDTLNFATEKTVASSGQLLLSAQSPANNIGVGGATGMLQLPASYFTTNFADGFSNIQIGSASQSSQISVGTFTLRDEVTFITQGPLNMTGKPELGANNLTLSADITNINVGSPANYFKTNGSGKLKRTIANNANVLFPIGNAVYNPLSIQNKTGSADVFFARVVDSVSLNGVSGTLITTPHIKATWDISKTNSNTGSGIDMTFTWSQSQESANMSNFVLNHHNGNNWEIAAGTSGSVSGSTTKTITHTGYTGTFSPFAFGNSTVTGLPVELTQFKASCQSDYIQIDWTTASEIRNKAFELFKSEDAQDWKLIHEIEGQGTKATETQYSFNDVDKRIGYYRLKDIDEDGIENWSQIIFADCKNDVSNIQIYPNPATDFIKVIVPQFENTTLNIISLEGKIIKTMPLISNQTLVSVKDLNSGVYMIEIEKKDSKEVIKLIKY